MKNSSPPYSREPLGAIWELHFGTPALPVHSLLSFISTLHAKDFEIQARCLFSSTTFLLLGLMFVTANGKTE